MSLHQPGPFIDIYSPTKIPSNWGGVPPPTFSPAPARSTVSSTPNLPINPQVPASNTSQNQWKPSAPSFVPRTQAAHPGAVDPKEPKMTFNSFMKGAAGSKWAAENLPSPAHGTAPQHSEQQVSSAAAPATVVRSDYAGNAGMPPASNPAAQDGMHLWKTTGSTASVSNPSQIQGNGPLVNGQSGTGYTSSSHSATGHGNSNGSAEPAQVGKTAITSGWNMNPFSNTVPAPAREMTPRPTTQQQGGWNLVSYLPRSQFCHLFCL